MKAKIAEIKSQTSEYQTDAKDLLLESAEMGFMSVTVIGHLPDGTVALYSSGIKNVAEKIGALEVAKLQLYDKWD